jgi:hypothetical protein
LPFSGTQILFALVATVVILVVAIVAVLVLAKVGGPK